MAQSELAQRSGLPRAPCPRGGRRTL